MQSTSQASSISKGALWGSRIITVLIALFMIFDGVTKIMKVPQVMEANVPLGIPEGQIPGIGILLLVCLVIYLIPQTSVLGAILMTGYLGGAIEANLRANMGAFPIVFSAIFGVLVWLALYLREPRLQSLIPFKSAS